MNLAALRAAVTRDTALGELRGIELNYPGKWVPLWNIVSLVRQRRRQLQTLELLGNFVVLPDWDSKAIESQLWHLAVDKFVELDTVDRDPTLLNFEKLKPKVAFARAKPGTGLSYQSLCLGQMTRGEMRAISKHRKRTMDTVETMDADTGEG